MLGASASAVYHIFLILTGALCLLLFAYLETAPWIAGSLPGFLLMLRTLPVVTSAPEEKVLDALLKPQAIGTFFAVLGMMICRLTGLP